jgi:predicted membrane channel-forming protein YqfA (hemolysin III family)
LENRKEDANNDDKNYSSAGYHKRRKNILTIGIPIVGAVIVLGVVFSIQASEQGSMGNKMVMHIHPQILLALMVNPLLFQKM